MRAAGEKRRQKGAFKSGTPLALPASQGLWRAGYLDSERKSGSFASICEKLTGY